jgi:hypothetical protein
MKGWGSPHTQHQQSVSIFLLSELINSLPLCARLEPEQMG